LLQGEQDVAKIDGALFGDTDTNIRLQREKPVHRLMFEMAAQGYNGEEIAKHTDYDPSYVRRLLKQPIAREHIVKTIAKTVQDEMKEFLEAEVLPSLRTLKAVRDGTEVRNQDRISASTALLDRFLGKPVQPMTTDAKPVASMSDDELRAKVQAEITASQPN
jgi:hypothetical protein